MHDEFFIGAKFGRHGMERREKARCVIIGVVVDVHEELFPAIVK
jgi:hypothetical protein